jgi:hypothetical protein
MSMSVGMRVLHEIVDEPLTARVGPEHAKLAAPAIRHASTPRLGRVGGRRLNVQPPGAHH